uniref:Uncharacterized protein n=1 Tax=Cyprinus carpio carpio TaxID=630221 RepID=A0A9J8D5I7_CYPCA
MRTLYRLKLVSSPNLSQLGKNEKASLEERGSGPNAIWNSIHNAVIAVFQKKGLADNELYTLNEGVSVSNVNVGSCGWKLHIISTEQL